MYPLSSKDLNRETDDAIYFYTPAFDTFNNFSAHRIEIWGMRFPTAEHAYQWRKFEETHQDISKQILNAGSPEEAQQIARRHKSKMPKDWHYTKVAVMEEILRAKLAQHETVRDTLKRSDNRKIIENSPIDSFWGCGPNGKGRNIVGILWMKLRESRH
ncbi:MAG TPA: Swarming motility protein ybiA [Candidatus Taylorbacteria bacterium]|nr:MAG: hypothetical protein UY03_C0017G0014 [Parcubacteria group bacterium GW2011_GWA2_47_64]KKU96269.1 MAG: hypothetical protein UY29_C0014G0005 [Parcubacteria group bacterium GW2011_GWC2_48_17]HBV01253.1 Swarming motility protein ybiA [Candidatus Taylorbacteria bacterium]